MAEQLQEFDEAAGSAGHRRRGSGKTFHEGLSLALKIATSPPAETEDGRNGYGEIRTSEGMGEGV